jgi:hypothetical protein
MSVLLRKFEACAENDLPITDYFGHYDVAITVSSSEIGKLA